MNTAKGVIAISGSTRFIEHMAVKAWEFEKAGYIALGCHLLPQWYTDAKDHLAEVEGVAARMDALHLVKIDMADRLYVVNVGGYIGEATRREIAHAEAVGKPVAYMEPPGGPPAITLDINGRDHEVRWDRAGYHDIAQFVGVRAEQVLTITYAYGPPANPRGSLYPDCAPIELRDGMRFCIVDTSNA